MWWAAVRQGKKRVTSSSLLRRRFTRIVLLAALISFTAGCVPTRVRPTVKVGLVAPFEGPYRAVGYDVIYAVRLALQEANAAGGVAGYTVELVAYDDRGEIEGAIEQARKIAIDPDVVAVLGHFRPATTRAALSTYLDAGVPLVAPGDPLGGIRLEGTPIYSAAPTIQRVSSVLGRYLNPRSCTALVRVDEISQWHDATPCDTLVAYHSGLNAAAVLNADVDAVFADIDAKSAGELAVALHDAEWNGRLVGGPDLTGRSMPTSHPSHPLTAVHRMARTQGHLRY